MTNTPTRVSVDGSGGGTCDTCHSRLDLSWLVKFSDGSYSTRCSTHLPDKFDRASVRRPGVAEVEHFSPESSYDAGVITAISEELQR